MGSNLQVRDVIMGDSLVFLIPRIAFIFEAPLLIFCQALTEIVSFVIYVGLGFSKNAFYYCQLNKCARLRIESSVAAKALVELICF